MCLVLDSNTESDKYIWPDKDKGQHYISNTKSITCSSMQSNFTKKLAFLTTNFSAKTLVATMFAPFRT